MTSIAEQRAGVDESPNTFLSTIGDFGVLPPKEILRHISMDKSLTKVIVRQTSELLQNGNQTYFTRIDDNGNRLRCNYLTANYDSNLAQQIILLLNNGTNYVFESCFKFLQHWFYGLKQEERNKYFDLFLNSSGDFNNQVTNVRDIECYMIDNKKEEIKSIKNQENCDAIDLMMHHINMLMELFPKFSPRKFINLLKLEIEDMYGIMLMFYFDIKSFESIKYREADGYYVTLEDPESGYTADIGANKIIQLCYIEWNKRKKSEKSKIISQKHKCDFSTRLGNFTCNNEVDEIVEWAKEYLLKFSTTFKNIEEINFYEKRRFSQTRNSVDSYKIDIKNLEEIIQICESCVNVKNLTAVEFASLVDMGMIIYHTYNKTPSNSTPASVGYKEAIKNFFRKIDQLGIKIHDYVGLQIIEPFLSHKDTIESIKLLQNRVRFSNKYTMMYHYISHHVIGQRNVLSIHEAIDKFPFNIYTYYMGAIETIRKAKLINSSWMQIGCGRSFDFIWKPINNIAHIVSLDVSEYGEVFLKTYHKKGIQPIKYSKQHQFVKLSSLPDMSMYDPFVKYWDVLLEKI